MGYQHIKGRATAFPPVTAGKANHRLCRRSIFCSTINCNITGLVASINSANSATSGRAKATGIIGSFAF